MKIDLSESRYSEIKELAEKNNLDLVVLFGSQAKGTAHKESDIDIGIYSKLELNLDDKIQLGHDLSLIFQNDNVDISIISYFSPLLSLQILKDAKVLYERENGIAATLKFYSWKLFAESKPFRDRSYAILKNRIAML